MSETSCSDATSSSESSEERSEEETEAEPEVREVPLLDPEEGLEFLTDYYALKSDQSSEPPPEQEDSSVGSDATSKSAASDMSVSSTASSSASTAGSGGSSNSAASGSGSSSGSSAGSTSVGSAAVINPANPTAVIQNGGDAAVGHLQPQRPKLKSLLKWPHNNNATLDSNNYQQNNNSQNGGSGDSSTGSKSSTGRTDHNRNSKKRVTFSDTMMVFCDDWPPELMPHLVSLKSPSTLVADLCTGTLVDWAADAFMFEPPLEYQDHLTIHHSHTSGHSSSSHHHGGHHGGHRGHHHHGSHIPLETMSQFEPPPDYRDFLQQQQQHGSATTTSSSSKSSSKANKNDKNESQQNTTKGTSTKSTNTSSSTTNKTSGSGSGGGGGTGLIPAANGDTLSTIAFIDDSDSSSDLEFIIRKPGSGASHAYRGHQSSSSSSSHHHNQHHSQHHAHHAGQHGHGHGGHHGKHAYNPAQQLHHHQQQSSRIVKPGRQISSSVRDQAIDVEKAAKLKDMLLAAQHIEEDTILGVLRQDSLLQAIGMTVEDFRAEDFIKTAPTGKGSKKSDQSEKSNHSSGSSSSKVIDPPPFEDLSSTETSASGDDDNSSDTGAAAARQPPTTASAKDQSSRRNSSTTSAASGPGAKTGPKTVKHTTTIQLKGHNNSSSSSSTSTISVNTKPGSEHQDDKSVQESQDSQVDRNTVLSPASSDTPSLREEMHSDASLTSQDTIILMTTAGANGQPMGSVAAIMAASTDSLQIAGVDLPSSVTCSPKSVIYTVHASHPPIYANVDYPDDDYDLENECGEDNNGEQTSDDQVNVTIGSDQHHFTPTTALVTLATTGPDGTGQIMAPAAIVTSGMGLLIPVSAHQPTYVSQDGGGGSGGSQSGSHGSEDEGNVVLREECILASPNDPVYRSQLVTTTAPHHPPSLGATHSPASSSIESSSLSSSDTSMSRGGPSQEAKTKTGQQESAAQVKSTQSIHLVPAAARREPLYENTVKYSSLDSQNSTDSNHSSSQTTNNSTNQTGADRAAAAAAMKENVNPQNGQTAGQTTQPGDLNQHFYSNLTETLNNGQEPHQQPNLQQHQQLARQKSQQAQQQQQTQSQTQTPQTTQSTTQRSVQYNIIDSNNMAAQQQQQNHQQITRSTSAGQVKMATRLVMANPQQQVQTGPGQRDSPLVANQKTPSQHPQQASHHHQQLNCTPILTVHPQMVPMVVSSPIHNANRSAQQQQHQHQPPQQGTNTTSSMTSSSSQQAHHQEQGQGHGQGQGQTQHIQIGGQPRIQMVCNPVYHIAAHPLYATLPRKVSASTINVNNAQAQQQQQNNFPKPSEIRRRDGLNAFPFVADSPQQNGFLPVPPLNPEGGLNGSDKTTPTDNSCSEPPQQSRERTRDELEAFVRNDLQRIERIRKRYSVSSEQEEDPTFGFSRRPSVRGIKSKYDGGPGSIAGPPLTMSMGRGGPSNVRVLSAVPISGPVRIIPAASLQHHLGSTPNLRGQAVITTTAGQPGQMGQMVQSGGAPGQGPKIRVGPAPPYQLHYVRLTPAQIQNLQAQQAMKAQQIAASHQQQQQQTQNQARPGQPPQQQTQPPSQMQQQQQQQQQQVRPSGPGGPGQNPNGRPQSMIQVPYVYPTQNPPESGQSLGQARIMTTQQIQQLRLQQQQQQQAQAQQQTQQGQAAGQPQQVLGSQAQLYRVTSMNSVMQPSQQHQQQQNNKPQQGPQQQQGGMMGMNMAMVQPRIITQFKVQDPNGGHLGIPGGTEMSPSPKHVTPSDSVSNCSSSSGSGPSTMSSQPSSGGGSGGPAVPPKPPGTAGGLGGPHHQPQPASLHHQAQPLHQQSSQHMNHVQLNNLNKTLNSSNSVSNPNLHHVNNQQQQQQSKMAGVQFTVQQHPNQQVHYSQQQQHHVMGGQQQHFQGGYGGQPQQQHSIHATLPRNHHGMSQGMAMSHPGPPPPQQQQGGPGGPPPGPNPQQQQQPGQEMKDNAVVFYTMNV